MYSPRLDSMPQLADDPWTNSSFIPPPFGATNGGQPGFYDAFPGHGHDVRGGYQSSSSWVPRRGTPYPTHQQLPGDWPISPAAPPNSAPTTGWTYGNYPLIETPTLGPTPPGPASASWIPAPAANSHAPWGAQTPAGTWGAASPASPWPAPQTPGGNPHAAFPGWGGGDVGQARPGPSTPYLPAPGKPFESSVGQPITGGWFGASPGGGGGGGAWGGGGGWVVPRKEKKKKRRSEHPHSHGHYDYEEPALYHSSSLRRSNSHGPPARRQSLQRSASWGNRADSSFPDWYGGGGGIRNTTPGYAQEDFFDETNLARRPRDWRPDYFAKPGFASYIPRLGVNRSTVSEYNAPIRRILHPLLQYDPTNPPIYYDLRSSPSPFSESSVDFLNLRRPHNPIDFAQLALQPACAFLRLYHPRFPWYVDIHQAHPNGVTVYDIFSQMSAQMHTPIHARHFWNEELGEAERRVVTLAFQERLREDKARLVPRGIVQVDYFGTKVVFEGLVRGQKGMWEMKTTRADP